MRERGKSSVAAGCSVGCPDQRLASCLSGWPSGCLLIACVPSGVPSLLCASDTQKEKEREREREREKERDGERERERERETEIRRQRGRGAHVGKPDVFEGLPCSRFVG